MRALFPARFVAAAPVAVVLLALALVGACWTSPSPDEIAVARSPRGVEGELRLTDRRDVRAELLAVHDSAYVILRLGRVTIVPFDAVEFARFDVIGAVAYWNGDGPDAAMRERLRLVSRYPFGIPAPALDALLRAGEQDSADVMVPVPRS